MIIQRNHVWKITGITFLSLSLLMTSCSHGRSAPQPVQTGIKVGSYYFPGHFNAARWSPMVAYGGPTPLLGHYRDGAPGVSDWHIRWAVEHGISFFVFDWYCSYRNGPNIKHNTALDEGFLKAEYRDLMEFALMWCNEESAGSQPYTDEDMLRMARNMGRYFCEKNYLRVDGRPLMIVSRPERMIKSFGTSFRDMIPRMSRAAGLPRGTDIFFVALASNPDSMLRDMGFAATTAYNYASYRAKKHGSTQRATYDDMIEGYEQIWRGMTVPDTLPYIVPVSPGWDSRPWYGSKAFVRTGSTPEKFRDMCQRARSYVNPELNMVLAECWNEFGEGAYIEPCEETGFGYLRAIRDVFATGEKPFPVESVPSAAEKASFTFHSIPPESRPAGLGSQKGNLVADPGMEEGTGWETYSGSACQFVKDNVHSGQHSLLIKPGHGCKTPVPIPVARGRAYRVSAWVKCTPGGTLNVKLARFDSKNRWTGQYDSISTCCNTDWTQVSKEIVIIDPETCAVSLEFVGNGADCRVDDVAIMNIREAVPPQIVLDLDCSGGNDWVTFTSGTPAFEKASDGVAHVVLADSQGMKTRHSVPVKPGEILGFRMQLKCDPMASISISSAAFSSDGAWLKGVYFSTGIYSWQDWIDITGVIRVPEKTTARSINLECIAEGGAVRIRNARIERDDFFNTQKN